MLALTKVVRTFPSTRVASESGGLPVEVALIAQLGHGAGDQLFDSAMRRQRGHAQFVDELDEPSARLGGVDLDKGDPTSLYSFGVGAKGHPFHRHAGHRVFTAISGSGGAQLRFSSASPEEILCDPQRFIKALRYVDIPPDSIFTVRFGGETWHQFAPLAANCDHPAFFALSCHTNELGGALSAEARSTVLANQASIPALTELLPDNVIAFLKATPPAATDIPRVALSLDAPAGSWHGRFCALVRGVTGRLRARLTGFRRVRGFLADNGGARKVVSLPAPPDDSLLLDEYRDAFHHEDTFLLQLEAGEITIDSASAMLARVLDGFLENRPLGVAKLMAFRNYMVKPFGLRTSPLGCPVSSLLAKNSPTYFAGRFPTLSQHVTTDDRRAQVILGADDKHLRFRSCVGVRISDNNSVQVTLGTRVQFRNLFGRLYMAVIDLAHRNYVSPTMLRLAVDYAIRSIERNLA